MEDLEDFSYLISLRSGVTFHVREVKPKDFYFAQTLRQKGEGHIPLVLRLLLDHSVLDDASVTETKTVLEWVSENVLDQSIFSVENWLEVSYHLCKQRWGPAIDWLEDQPMSKIQTMIQIVKTHAEEQEKEMKKSAKRKK